MALRSLANEKPSMPSSVDNMSIGYQAFKLPRTSEDPSLDNNQIASFVCNTVFRKTGYTYRLYNGIASWLTGNFGYLLCGITFSAFIVWILTFLYGHTRKIHLMEEQVKSTDADVGSLRQQHGGQIRQLIQGNATLRQWFEALNLGPDPTPDSIAAVIDARVNIKTKESLATQKAELKEYLDKELAVQVKTLKASLSADKPTEDSMEARVVKLETALETIRTTLSDLLSFAPCSPKLSLSSTNSLTR